MTKAERDQWVEALRSGKYKQAQGHLRDGDGYCCLGVKRDIDGASWERTESGAYCTEVDGTQFPSSITLERWGLSEADKWKVADLNDVGWTFAEIADWIEANVPVEETSS